MTAMIKRPLSPSAEESQAKRHEPFRGLGRDAYMQQRIHRKLHAQAALLDDESLQQIGEMSFNDQFPSMEQMFGNSGGPGPGAAGRDCEGLFAEFGFQGFLQQRVHRSLQSIAARFTPEELLALGKLSFSEQFTSLGVPGPKEQAAPGLGQRVPPRQGRPMMRQAARSPFGDLGRDAFLQQRVHRMLHPQAHQLSDADLLALGHKGFKEQFVILGVPGPKEAAANDSLFGDQGRTGYVYRHIHKRLHDAVQGLADEDIHALGQQSFHEQFKTLGQDENAEPNAVFGKDSRESYIQSHVHRKLHPHVAAMSDEEVYNLGKLGFNEQFRTLSVDVTEADEVNFGQSGRAGYIQQHIHRRLHVRAAQLNDKDLLDLGKLPFNEQFVVLQQPGPREDEVALFGDQGREAFIQQRIHRMLHAQVVNLPDTDVHRLGEMSFREQFAAMGRPGPKEMDAMKMHQARLPPEAASGIPFLRGLTRQDYMQQRIHRKLHSQAAYFSDEELFQIGELSFNDQFNALEGKTQKIRAHVPGLFGSLDRSTFMQQRVHRKLHGRAMALSDQDLAQLGALSFNEQFGRIELMPLEG